MTDFLAFLNSGIITAVNIIKWASVLFLTFHIAILGFDVMNNGKDSTDVLTKVKAKIIPLSVGFFMVIACSTLQTTIEKTLTDIDGDKKTENVTGVTGSEVQNESFSWGSSSSNSGEQNKDKEKDKNKN